MKKIVTIWGWNWQSNLLDWLNEILWNNIKISSIVSMSDDWRTTWKLMKSFKEELWLHLPPPWDLRRCLFSLSSSKYKQQFVKLLESVIIFDWKVSDFTILDILNKLGEKNSFIQYLRDFDSVFLDFKLPLKSDINWHKFWNLLMASIFYNLWNDYDKMIDFMHKLLKVDWKIIPVTTKKANIRAVLWNGDIIESQDRISNVSDYNSWISDLELMDCSKDACHNIQVHNTIVEADYIIIWPWDLFTSIISNFIIWGVKKSIAESNAKIIYIWNSTNKWWETIWLTQLDFVNKIERFLWKRINYFVLNNKKPNLSKEELIEFKNDISVKWGDYLFLSNWERSELKRRKINVIETPLLSQNSFYKHSKEKLIKTLEKIIL